MTEFCPNYSQRKKKKKIPNIWICKGILYSLACMFYKQGKHGHIQICLHKYSQMPESKFTHVAICFERASTFI